MVRSTYPPLTQKQYVIRGLIVFPMKLFITSLQLHHQSPHHYNKLAITDVVWARMPVDGPNMTLA